MRLLSSLASAWDDGITSFMQKAYVKKDKGAFRIGDTRVSLGSLGCLFREGMSVESMVESYSALTLEQVHGALAFYLANQKRSMRTLLQDSALQRCNTRNRDKPTPN